MSKKKSLGSSPIGFSSLGINSFEFIPSIDLPKENNESENKREEAFKNNEHSDELAYHSRQNGRVDYDSLFTDFSASGPSKEGHDENHQVDKKIVSYYLEEELVERLKEVADQKNMYYSTLVSNAIYYWLEQNTIT